MFRDNALNLGSWVARALALTSLLAGVSLASVPKTYDAPEDWEQGEFFNVIQLAGSLKLVDSTEVQTFPTIWPANAGEDTVSKVDTDTCKEVGRYRTWFDIGTHSPWAGPAPSRTAVAANGDVIVVNRMFSGGTRNITVMRISINDVGCVDRNGNGKIDTATDLDLDGNVTGTEILPCLDDGGGYAGATGTAGNGQPELDEFRDERIKWFVQIPGTFNAIGRSCAIDPKGRIWVGGFNARSYWVLDQNTGAVLKGPISSGNCSNYGAVVNSAGMLYGATLTGCIVQIDTNTDTFVRTIGVRDTYGISIDNARKRVYFGDPRGFAYGQLDFPANTISYPASGTTSYGVGNMSNGDILVHGAIPSAATHKANGGTAGSRLGITRWRPDASLIFSGSNHAGLGGGSRGIGSDSKGNIWTVDLNTHSVQQFDGTDGCGVCTRAIGTSPYTYSDFTGNAFLTTNVIGTWSVTYDDIFRGTTDCALSWDTTGSPAGSSVKLEIAGSDTPGVPGPFVDASNGVSLGDSVEGSYLFIKVTMQADPDGDSPCVNSLTLTCFPQRGDFNGDKCIDRSDLLLLLKAMRSGGPLDPFDVTGDGQLNILDARRLVVMFCNPGGAPCGP